VNRVNSQEPTSSKRTRIERILEPFGARHAAGLVTFFERVADAEVDIVLFMARKSLCIYRMMEVCGARKIRQQIFSDAILETEAAELSNKRILVVDDTLFVGTTLADAKSRIDMLSVKSVEYWVYCADGETWSPDTFEPNYIHEVISARDAIEFCSAECRAMINAGIPYLTDFATSGRVRMTPDQLDRVIKPISWSVHDVSSQYHERSKVKYYSSFPDVGVNRQVEAIVGTAVFQLIELAKVRIHAAWSGRFYEVTFVPVITLCPTDFKAINQALNALCSVLGTSSISLLNTSTTEKVRAIQFIVGALFMRTFWEANERVLTIDLTKKFQLEWCKNVFQTENAEVIANCVNIIYSGAAIKYNPIIELRNLQRSEPAEIRKETLDDIESFMEDYFAGDSNVDFGHTPLSDLTAIFLEFQSKFEVAARQEIREKNPNPLYRNRLKRGMAWRALCKYLFKKYSCPDSRENRNILSLVLDRLIDFGVAVPIIALSEKIIYRAYRHGEDVRYGAQEESLIFNLLLGFEAGRGTSGIEATYIEKLIVILLRVGMNEEWLNLWYSNSGRDTLVRVGFHLQGAVPIIPRREDELVPEGEDSWLSRRLLRTGTLRAGPKKPGGGTYYNLGNEPEAAHVRADAPRTAKALGYTIGKACISGGGTRTAERPISTEDLIVLTSCANAVDTTGAVAAEMQIFCDWYREVGSLVLRGEFENPRSRSFSQKVKGSRGAQAVNSAEWKLQKFRAGAIQDVTSKILALSKSDPEWFVREEYWKAVIGAFERRIDGNEERRFIRLQEAFDRILVCQRFLLDAIDRLAHLARTLDSTLLQDFVSFLEQYRQEPECGLSISADLANRLVLPSQSSSELRRTLGQVSRAIDSFARQVCSLSYQEAKAAETLILKSNVRLSRVQYSHLVYYDILDIRVRKQETPDRTNRYGSAIDRFRSEVNSMLDDDRARLQATGGDLFAHTGDLHSTNDSKHIFLNVPGGALTEANRIVSGIARLSSSFGVQVRVMSVPTNLRGDYVFLNKGTTSVDNDTVSHFHTIIQEVTHHEIENSLSEGGTVVWILKEIAASLIGEGSIRFRGMDELADVAIDVNIRSVLTKTRMSCYISDNAD
jgi:hypothetical protein